MPLLAQSSELDSLIGVFENNKEHDTARAQAAILYTNYTYQSDLQGSVNLLDEQIKRTKKSHAVWAGKAAHAKAKFYQRKSKFGLSFKAVQEALEYFEQANFKSGIAHAYNVKANIYIDMGEYDKALEFYLKSLVIFEEIENLNGQAIALSGLGDINQLTGRPLASIDYYKKAIAIDSAQNYLPGIASSMVNMGAAYHRLKDFDQANYYYARAGAIHKEIGNLEAYANTMNNLGLLLMDQEDDQGAIAFYMLSLRLSDSLNETEGMSTTYRNLGAAEYNQGNYDKAIEYCLKAKFLAETDSIIDGQFEACECLRDVYQAKGNYKLAYDYAMITKSLEDSLHNVSSMRDITQREMKYGFDKVLLTDSLAHQEEIRIQKAEKRASDAKKDAEIQKNRWIIIASIIGLLLVMFYAVILWRSNKARQRANKLIREQKEEVELQKDIVEEKNKEIIDSINYAKRLQVAILPPTKLVKEWLPESFVLYKPKDIVAGDFYWMESMNGWTYFAAADCTGHGVPGAMVSVICSNALSKALVEEGNMKPSDLLDRARELVIDRFGRSEEDIKDGMDISLCALNWETKEMMWAGANNPLWIIRPGIERLEESIGSKVETIGQHTFIEIKADKQPIGNHRGAKPFTNHLVQLNEGDTIYIFSDGFPDQFGGERGKKYKSTQFKRFILSVQDKAMQDQRTSLDHEFEDWRGQVEQLDDVCVIGVRL